MYFFVFGYLLVRIWTHMQYYVKNGLVHTSVCSEKVFVTDYNVSLFPTWTYMEIILRKSKNNQKGHVLDILKNKNYTNAKNIIMTSILKYEDIVHLTFCKKKLLLYIFKMYYSYKNFIVKYHNPEQNISWGFMKSQLFWK